MSDIGRSTKKSFFKRHSDIRDREIFNPEVNILNNQIAQHDISDLQQMQMPPLHDAQSYGELGSLQRRQNSNTMDSNLEALPTGKVYKNGTNILKPTKAFDVYKPEAIYLDQNKHADGNVREVNGNLYARGENPIIEYAPSAQIVQPNGHITAISKNFEADQRLANANQMYQINPYAEIFPKVMMGAIGGIAMGYLLGSRAITLSSLMLGGGAAYMMDTQNNSVGAGVSSSPQGSNMSDFSQRMSNLV